MQSHTQYMGHTQMCRQIVKFNSRKMAKLRQSSKNNDKICTNAKYPKYLTYSLHMELHDCIVLSHTYLQVKKKTSSK